MESNPVGLLLLIFSHLIDCLLTEQARIVVDNTFLLRQVDLEWLVGHLDDPLIRTDEGDGEVVSLLRLLVMIIFIIRILLVQRLVFTVERHNIFCRTQNQVGGDSLRETNSGGHTCVSRVLAVHLGDFLELQGGDAIFE